MRPPNASSQEIRRNIYIPPSSPAALPEIVKTRVKGIRFDIPRDYFRYPPNCGEDQDGVTLRALLPDMLPATPSNEARLQSVVGGWGARIQLIYGDFPHRDLDRTFKATTSGIDPTLNFAESFGLNSFPLPERPGRDVFFETQAGRVSFFIECDQVIGTPFPGCTQYFLYRNEQIRIHFDRKFLADWRGVRDKVIAMLNRFSINP